MPGYAAVRFRFFGLASGTTVRSGERSNSLSLSGSAEKGTAREKSSWVSSRTSPSSFVNGFRLDMFSPCAPGFALEAWDSTAERFLLTSVSLSDTLAL